jgi:hypothetical protein
MTKLKNLLAAFVISAFAIVSAQAGEMTLTGSMEISNTKTGGVTTGNGLGQENELAITGSTELDNGIGVSYKQTVGDKFAFNDSELMFATAYGTIGVSSTGGSIEDIDNIVPTAFEEAEALISFTTSTGFLDIGNNDGTYGIVYKNAVPGTGMNVTGFYTPKGGSGDGTASDDAPSGDVNAADGKAYSVYLRGNPLNLIEGVDVAVGYENTESNAVSKATATDEESYTAAVNYTWGPVKVGYQKGYLHTGSELGSGVEGYKNTYMGIAYAVNDNLSVSYQNTVSRRLSHSGEGIETDINGYSAAYTSGGMTLAYVDNTANNANYTANTTRTGSQIVLSIAF